ncbi:SAC3 family protein A isoform X2 [Citrus sinensis]|uniref:SAC3 family protein A isoform X2 n=1 Tax=Citrus clementina TaxID=85681 RepID=UPI000CED4E2F|nr:SAC3 family protein A isoform X2 [Citrus x clementina]XP_052295447.1 SAC3 family protein A isoform X2 [Citrus sinensis]
MMMMNQNQQGSTQNIASSVDPNSVENRYVVDASQSQASSYFPSTTGSGAVSWVTHGVNNQSTENGNLSNASYHHEQHTESHVKSLQDGLNATSLTSSSNLGTTNVAQDYSGYTSYPNSSDPYAYGSTAYPGYYSSYQQQPNHSYPQPVGAYQNSGAPYQPISSFQNSGSYVGPASYSATYYSPGDYQTAGGYPSSGYSHQTTSWNEGNYTNYTSHQYSNYTSDTSGAYSSGTAPATSLQYQQQYKQWADYYSQTEVSCAPGTENLSVASTSNQVLQPPGVTAGYPTAHSQPAPIYHQSWQQDSSSSHVSSLQPAATSNGSHDSYWKHGTPSFQNRQVSPVQPHYSKPLEQKTSYNNFQDQHKAACPQGPSSQYAIGQQMAPSYQSPPVQTSPQLDNRRVSKLQIPTNPRIASNLALGLPKTDKDSSTANAAAKPAYIGVSLAKSNEKVVSHADSRVEPGTFPKSLCGYVERALARCKGDAEIAASQAVMGEIIKKANSDGTLFSRDWDVEPLFPKPTTEAVTKDLPTSTPLSALSKNKRSPSRRTKSRWEPLPEEKPIDKLASSTNEIVKFSGWIHANEKDRKHISGSVSKEDRLNNIKFHLSEQKSASKSFQRPVKRQRLSADGFKTEDNGDASSDSDKEQSLTSYYSGAIALANSPEERMRRENRSKRFDRGQGNRSETNRFKGKNAGTGNLYVRRASALLISKSFDDGGSRAVEDIDWDALTVKGTCQEIEKRYLRLTSAPDPSTVRPEEVLEKALQMVQNSQKNYLYKCDQLKSIRQDLTVQRIRNQLTAKCQSQLKILYAEGIEGCCMEFSAYHLLCVILHSNNKRELLSLMSRLSDKAKQDKAVKHALAVRAAVSSGNYIMFFRLYKTAPNLNTCLMDLYVEKMRFKAVSCMSRSYRPTVPVSYVAQVLGFTGVSPTNEECEERDSDGLEECVEWLKAHGASLVTDANGEVQLDAKASSSTLFMPEPEDAVSHGDANLAVNDFLARASSQPS